MMRTTTLLILLAGLIIARQAAAQGVSCKEPLAKDTIGVRSYARIDVKEFDGRVFFQVGLNAVVGRKREDWKVEPTRFDEMRPGCYDIEARIRDMDINGVWASVNFPSQITGFCGAVFSRCSDPELGLAVTRAWNDWFHDEWYSAHPHRIVPMGITYLADAEQGAEEIRRNAARGFTAVTLPEMPHRIGMEPMGSEFHAGRWEEDMARLAALAEVDWQVLPFTDFQVRHREQTVVRAVRGALVRAGHRFD